MSSAIITLSSNLTGVTFPINPLPFDVPVTGDPEMFGPPGYLIVPEGYRYARVTGCIELESGAVAGMMYVGIRLFDGPTPCMMNTVRQGSSGFDNNVCMSVLPWQPAFEGDVYSMRVHIGGLSGVDSVLAGPNSFLSLELAP